MTNLQKFSKTIEYKGTADFSQIISQLKQLYSEAEKGGTKQSDLLGLDKQIKKVEDLRDKIETAISKGFSSPQEFKQFDKQVDELIKNANELGTKFGNIHFENLAKQAKKFKDELKDAEKALNDSIKSQKELLTSSLKNVDGSKEYVKALTDAAKEGKDVEAVEKNITKQLDDQIEKRKAAKELAQSNVNETKQNIQNLKENSQSITNQGLGRKEFKSTKNGETVNFNKIKTAYADAVSGSSNANAAFSKFKKSLADLGVEYKHEQRVIDAFKKSFDIQAEVKQAEKDLKSYETELTNATKAYNKAEDNKEGFQASINSEEVKKGYQDITNSLEEVNTAKEESKAADEKLENSTVPQSVQNYSKSVDDLSDSLDDARVATEENVIAQQNLDNKFDSLKSTVTQVLSLTAAWRELKQILSETYENVKEIDASFTSIAMVTDYSVSDMWESYPEYAEMANELGQETNSVIQSSALFYQQGLETNEALELTTSTMKLATLAGSDFETATGLMTAALRGFHMEMSEGETVSDVYSELAANAAASVNDIANAMSKTASIANNAGMSFETTAALLTKTIETTQESAENIG